MRRLLNRFQKEHCYGNLSSLTEEVRGKQLSGAAVKRLAKELIDLLPADRGDEKLLQVVCLLIHDHLPQAERLLGKREDTEACYVRGLIMRRQGNLAGACKYFRMAQGLPVFVLMAETMQSRDELRPVLRNFPNLIQNHMFNPTPMAGVVQQIALGGHKNLARFIEQMQAIEYAEILAWLAGQGHRKVKRLQQEYGLAAEAS